jgi:phenylacetate-CoA ligase
MIPEIEKQTKAQIKSFQEEKLHSALQYLQANSPFYKRHFQQHQVKVDSIKSLEDLVSIPTVSKDDLQKHNWDFLCVPRSKIIEYTTTSGTMGRPVIVALTKNDLKRLGYNEFISLRCADGTSNDIYQFMLTLDRQFMAGIAYYEGVRQMGAGIVRVGPGVPSLQLETIKAIGPTSIIAVPSYIVKLIEKANQEGIDLNETPVKKIICIGESIRTTGLELNTLGKRITYEWNVKLFGTYASTEMQTAFTECSHGAGGHHHPELIITEVLNDLDRPVSHGEVGNLTITTLGVEGMPLLRYKTGDMTQLHEEVCACGRSTSRVGPVVGRKQQMIKLKGTTIYPSGIFEILHEAGSLNNYLVEVATDKLGTDELKLFVTEEINKAQLAELFRSRLRVSPEIIVASHQEIEARQMSEGKRKPTKFIDSRNLVA